LKTLQPHFENLVTPDAIMPRTFRPIQQVASITVVSEPSPDEFDLDDILKFEEFLGIRSSNSPTSTTDLRTVTYDVKEFLQQIDPLSKLLSDQDMIELHPYLEKLHSCSDGKVLMIDRSLSNMPEDQDPIIEQDIAFKSNNSIEEWINDESNPNEWINNESILNDQINSESILNNRQLMMTTSPRNNHHQGIDSTEKILEHFKYLEIKHPNSASQELLGDKT
jgi:hypothetical protein